MFKARDFRGFSLVEVSLALGIISFAFVALFGMIPIGLNSFAAAIDATVETQIIQRVTTIARQSKFTELAKLDRVTGRSDGIEAPDFFFDEQGNEVLETEAIEARKYIYTVAANLKTESAVPGNGGIQEVNPNLATILLTIRRISAPKDARYASILIANNGL